jgi:hypothetical protein
MAQVQSSHRQAATATRDDLRGLFGDIDERKVLDIMALNPATADVEEAALWVIGDGDVLGKLGHPLSGIAAEVLEILTADDEDER